MHDVPLIPDDHDGILEPSRRQMRLTTGLAPTAAMPKARTQDLPPAYAPCPHCGQPVLTGQTRAGACLVLDISQTTYTVIWQKDEALPTLALSRAYPLHWCVPGAIGRSGP